MSLSSVTPVDPIAHRITSDGTLMWHKLGRKGCPGGAISIPRATVHLTLCYRTKGDPTFRKGET